MGRRSVPQDTGKLWMVPNYRPPLTWGLGNQLSSWEPGPGGPLHDPRKLTITPGPVYGRVGPLSILRAFSPGNLFPMLNPWPQQSVNNRYGVFLADLYTPGIQKPPATANSGF